VRQRRLLRLVFCLATLMTLSGVFATPLCIESSLADYIALASNGCTTDGIVKVKDITYSVITTNGAIAPTAQELTVLPSTNFGPLSQITGSEWVASLGQTLEIDLGFTFEAIIPQGTVIVLDSVISNELTQFPRGVGVTVDTYYCAGLLVGMSCNGISGTVHWDDGGHPFGVPRSPVLVVQQHYYLQPTSNPYPPSCLFPNDPRFCSGLLVAQSLFPQDLATTSEPGSLWMCGPPIVALLWLRKQRSARPAI
jgi:hypothetical protein